MPGVLVAAVKRVVVAKWLGLGGLLIVLLHRILIHTDVAAGWSPNQVWEQDTLQQWLWTASILLALNFTKIYWDQDPPKIVYYGTGFIGNMSVFFAVSDMWVWHATVMSQVPLLLGGGCLYFYAWALEPNRLAKRRAVAA